MRIFFEIFENKKQKKTKVFLEKKSWPKIIRIFDEVCKHQSRNLRTPRYTLRLYDAIHSLRSCYAVRNGSRNQQVSSVMSKMFSSESKIEFISSQIWD